MATTRFRHSKDCSGNERQRFRQNVIAMVYDFDGTLTPQPMQDYTVLPEACVTPKEFWAEVNDEVQRTGGDAMLVYMRLLLEKLHAVKKHVSRANFRRLAKGIKYFPGTATWFDQMNKYVMTHGLRVQHYIISAGLREILDGISLKKHFKQIYASEYFFDYDGKATFPQLLVNDTAKTQFIFRINKGKEDSRESINEYMPEGERPIPFSHILYIGDGMTDVPCMTVTKKNGGYAIAVYKPKNHKSLEICKKLATARRIDCFAPADYRKGSELDVCVRRILDVMIAHIKHEQDVFKSRHTG